MTVPVTDRGEVVGALRVSAPMGEVDESVRSSWLALGLIGLAVVAAGLVLAWILAGTIARPVEKLRAAAGRLGRGDLDARVEPEGPQEIDELGRSFNRMAGELSVEPGRPAGLRRQRLPPAAHAADRDQAPPRGDSGRGRGRGRAGGQGRSRARPAERARRRPAGARARRGRPGAGRERRPGRSRAGRRAALGPAGRRGRARAGGRRRPRRPDLGSPGGRGPHPRQPARERDSLLAARLANRGRLERNERPSRVRGLGHRPRHPRGRARRRSSSASTAARKGRAPGPARGSGSRSWPSSPSAGTGRVELLDGPGTRVRASFPAPPAESSPPPNHS